jgi:hypothetical protein
VAANPLKPVGGEEEKSYLDTPVWLDGSSLPCGSIRATAAASSFCIGNNGENPIGGSGIDVT